MSRAQAAIDATALRVAPLDEAVGRAIVDAYSVVHDRDTGPCSVPVIATLADGRRTIARSDDAELARHLSGGMFIGDTIEMTIGADGPTFHLV
jgi:acetyl-CoA C-acetyltransferase